MEGGEGKEQEKKSAEQGEKEVVVGATYESIQATVTRYFVLEHMYSRVAFCSITPQPPNPTPSLRARMRACASFLFTWCSFCFSLFFPSVLSFLLLLV